MDDRGVCFVCGCTQFDPCMIPAPCGRMMPCSWANEEKTLCNNPECLAEAFGCPTCGIDLRSHTPLMQGGCMMREMRAMFDAPDQGPSLIYQAIAYNAALRAQLRS